MLLHLPFEGAFQSVCSRANVVFSRALSNPCGTVSVRKKFMHGVYTFQPVALFCESRAVLTSWAYDKGQ